MLNFGALEVTHGLGTLQKLPRELRDMIYSYAIANGTMALLRASKQTNYEVSELIFQKGIHRMALDSNKDDRNPPLKRTPTKKIQNLQIRVSWPIRDLDQRLPKLERFLGSAIQRKECAVIIGCDPFEDCFDGFKELNDLSGLTGFGRVSLELDLQWSGEPWPDTMKESKKNELIETITAALDFQKECLEAGLGTARVLVGKNSLVFYPRK